MPVYLIGAGPGDPDLITLKAVKALNKRQMLYYTTILPTMRF